MPRQQKIEAEAEKGASVLDAFAVARGTVPRSFEQDAVGPAEQPKPVASEPASAAKPSRRHNKPAPAKDDQPLVRRMGRRRTGRNVQFNQSVTAETANRFYDLQAQLNVPMGEVLERASLALADQLGAVVPGNRSRSPD